MGIFKWELAERLDMGSGLLVPIPRLVWGWELVVGILFLQLAGWEQRTWRLVFSLSFPIPSSNYQSPPWEEISESLTGNSLSPSIINSPVLQSNKGI